MTEFLKEAKRQNSVLHEIEKELKINIVEFRDIKLDYLTVTLYGNFEKDLNDIIERKIAANNNFNRNYIQFLRNNDYKLHRGTTKNKFKELIKQTFNKDIIQIISNSDWQLYANFMDFRHSIAHATPKYKAYKNLLLSNTQNIDDIITVLETILIKLDNIKNVQKIST